MRSSPWELRERLFAVGLWVSFGLLAWRSAADYLSRPFGDRLADLHIYFEAIGSLQGPDDLYSYASPRGATFNYPPFAAVVLWPIRLADEPTLRILWTVATLLAVCAIGYIACRSTVRRSEHRVWVWPLMCVVLLVSRPVQGNLRFGQVSLFLSLLVLVDLVALEDTE